jgi:RluA family pseudouridine synthase
MMRRSGVARHRARGLAILYEDDHIVAVDKPAGLLTMGTESDKTRTAYFMITDYVRKGYSKSRKRIFIVHRLDRDTSGILIFAKTIEAKLYLQKNWQQTRKKYLAVVHGRCRETAATITTYLAQNKAHVVYSTANASEGRLSRTAYRVLQQTRDFSLLDVDLLTGRKHQIRVHLADIGHPVVGDTTYGRHDGRRLALHARSIFFHHPCSGKPLTLEAPIPPLFRQLVGPTMIKDSIIASA